jgi:hypothetical protein
VLLEYATRALRIAIEHAHGVTEPGQMQRDADAGLTGTRDEDSHAQLSFFGGSGG